MVPLAALAIALIAFAAPASAKSVTYKPVKGHLKVTNQVSGTFPDGSVFGGESTETYEGGKGKRAVLTVDGPGDLFPLAFPARYSFVGFELVRAASGEADDCSGPLPASSFGAQIGVFLSPAGKHRFDAEWTNVQPTLPQDDCGFFEDPAPPPARVIEHESGKLGKADELELTTKGTLDYSGQDYFHTLTWSGKVVVKKGGAVSG